MPKLPPCLKNQTPKVRLNTNNDIIYSYQWEKVSKNYRELHPICERCLYLNQVDLDSVRKLSVHHIKGRLKYPQLAFNYANLLTLCSRCHNGYFTKLEQEGQEEKAIKEGEEIKRFSE